MSWKWWHRDKPNPASAYVQVPVVLIDENNREVRGTLMVRARPGRLVYTPILCKTTASEIDRITRGLTDHLSLPE